MTAVAAAEGRTLFRVRTYHVRHTRVVTIELVLGREMRNPFFTSNTFRRDIAQGVELERQLRTTFPSDKAI
jgi:hypothetical protein